MKFFVGVLVAFLAVGGVLSLPARSPSDDAEVIDVPRRQVLNGRNTDDSEEDAAGIPDFKHFNGVIDTGAGYPFLQPHPLPFSLNLGFFDAFEDIFSRLRNQLSAAGGVGDTLSTFDLDSSKGNTTSTIKIVDGHKIEVNETVYGDKDSVFQVRLVNIRPVDSGEADDDSGEAAAPAAAGAKAPANNPPVTSSPKQSERNDNIEGDDEDESDERREPLANENEIKRNEPELDKLISTNNILSPVTNENNTANLNPTFIRANSIEVMARKAAAKKEEEDNEKVVEGNSNKHNSNDNGNIEQNTEAAAQAAGNAAEVVAIDSKIETEINVSMSKGTKNNNNVKEVEAEVQDEEKLQNTIATKSEVRKKNVAAGEKVAMQRRQHTHAVKNNEQNEAEEEEVEETKAEVKAETEETKGEVEAEAEETKGEAEDEDENNNNSGSTNESTTYNDVYDVAVDIDVSTGAPATITAYNNNNDNNNRIKNSNPATAAAIENEEAAGESAAMTAAEIDLWSKLNKENNAEEEEAAAAEEEEEDGSKSSTEGASDAEAQADSNQNKQHYTSSKNKQQQQQQREDMSSTDDIEEKEEEEEKGAQTGTKREGWLQPAFAAEWADFKAEDFSSSLKSNDIEPTKNDYLSNDIDINDNVANFVDLSNDIAVNDLAAEAVYVAGTATVNPDAEIIDVANLNPSASTSTQTKLNTPLGKLMSLSGMGMKANEPYEMAFNTANEK